ncbi:DUF1836 domain-containing protein [Ferdinandcohnia quinoae]|uniref:DUF1836 domain-containing protein n=1 Tax=Fredinandcohnia quinoae TaxID=2918902 RepID=A0AAW5DZY7_9BACI|nr:DUF1836 domain-containing protein [Fredinandcohnia sp. SECRCQ15]MCH1625618.1 DUF1836 domain-containing protein [Fredinandcohnia sp. SECRCQ15]
MKDAADIIEKLGLEHNISLDDIPKIDLYMDQVIQLFENKFSATTRDENEKVLTKTMINNYAKGKLLIPIKNKKYSKEHLILISLIYQLKSALSINDIKATLEGVNKKVVEEDFNVEDFYNSYLNLYDKDVDAFKVDLQARVEDVADEITKFDDNESEYLEQVLLISSLVNISNLYKRAAEKLVDEIIAEKRDREPRDEKGSKGKGNK